MHGLQLDVPLASWYVPAAHDMHAPDRDVLEKEPAGHGVCMVLPVVEKKPVEGR